MENSRNGGIGLSGTLFIVFLILKLVKVIDWSWWWVCSPLWIPVCLGIITAIILVILDSLGCLTSTNSKK
jgi:hypothetical protein